MVVLIWLSLDFHGLLCHGGLLDHSYGPGKGLFSQNIGRSYDINPAFSEEQTSLFVQGQSDAHRPIREILHRTPGCSLTSSGLLASQGKTSPGCILALLLSVKPTIQHSVLIKKGGLSSQPGLEPPIHHCRLISPKCLSTVEVRNPQAAICPGPSFCITAGAEPGFLLRLSTGMTGLSPPAVLPLASRPFKPAFMSLSVLHGRPRCRASFPQLPSSQDTMLSSVCRQRHFHGKGSELNPLLILSETPCQADTVC